MIHTFCFNMVWNKQNFEMAIRIIEKQHFTLRCTGCLALCCKLELKYIAEYYIDHSFFTNFKSVFVKKLPISTLAIF